MDILDKIQQLMDDRDWSTYKLAKQADLPESTLMNLFRRNHAPTFATLDAICKACGITLAQFFTEGENSVVLTQDQQHILSKWSTLTEKQKSILLELISNMN